MIIGLTGSYCSGKDTVADYLVEKKGFTHCSLSDVLRDDMRSRGIAVTRENLIREGTSLRQRSGNNVLAVKALQRCASGGKFIISSIRHPAEIEELRKRKDFILVNVDASPRVRFERMRKRNRENDPSTFELFLEFEKRESQTEGPGQQLSRCMKMADVTLMNDGNDRSALYARVDGIISGLEKKCGR